MNGSDLIITPSGIRGIFGKGLTFEASKRIAIAFGSWLNHKTVIIGRDTRPSGDQLKEAIIEGLLTAECHVIDLGVCPTPAIIHKKNELGIPAGIIISGSHNPPEWQTRMYGYNLPYCFRQRVAWLAPAGGRYQHWVFT